MQCCYREMTSTCLARPDVVGVGRCVVSGGEGRRPRGYQDLFTGTEAEVLLPAEDAGECLVTMMAAMMTMTVVTQGQGQGQGGGDGLPTTSPSSGSGRTNGAVAVRTLRNVRASVARPASTATAPSLHPASAAAAADSAELQKFISMVTASFTCF